MAKVVPLDVFGNINRNFHFVSRAFKMTRKKAGAFSPYSLEDV
jgi:hypothetical protein